MTNEEEINNMDKVQKIREEVARIQLYSQSEVLKKILDFIDSLQEEPVSIWHDASEKPEHDDLLIETNDGRIIHRQSINNYGMVKRWAYTSALLNLDNSCNLGNNSQEEPVSNVVDDSDISCDAVLCAAHTGCKYFNPNKKSNVNHCIGGLPLQLRQKKAEPVSEELETEIQRYYVDWDEHPEYMQTARHFAQWQKEQFEKNRLEHCNSITEEQYNLEVGFIDQHLDKYNRMPTFLDAIEYGMRLKEKEMQSTIELAEDHAMLAGMEKMKEEMMAKAIDGDITFDYYGDGDKTYGCIAHNSFCLEDFGLKDKDKVKVIVIKED